MHLTHSQIRSMAKRGVWQAARCVCLSKKRVTDLLVAQPNDQLREAQLHQASNPSIHRIKQGRQQAKTATTHVAQGNKSISDPQPLTIPEHNQAAQHSTAQHSTAQHSTQLRSLLFSFAACRVGIPNFSRPPPVPSPLVFSLPGKKKERKSPFVFCKLLRLWIRFWLSVRPFQRATTIHRHQCAPTQPTTTLNCNPPTITSIIVTLPSHQSS